MICFLDRDGVINVDYPYVGTIDRFEWCPYVFEILRNIKNLGYQFVMITNQSGINRGFYSYREFLDLSFYIHEQFKAYDLSIEINYCPHSPEEKCNCRKPSPQMINRYPISQADIFIGDKFTDMQAAYSAGIPNRWMLSNDCSPGPFTLHFSSHLALKLHTDMLLSRT